MRNILKWSVIIIVAIFVLRFILDVIVNVFKWIFKLFANIVSALFHVITNLTLGTAVFVLVALAFVTVAYFMKAANKSYDKTIENNRRNKLRKRKNTELSTQHIKPIETKKAEPIAQLNDSTHDNQFQVELMHMLHEQPNGLKIDFISFVQSLHESQLTAIVDHYYDQLFMCYKEQIGFGEVGATEFVGSLLVMEYTPQMANKISHGHHNVFTKEWGPLQYSNYMDELIEVTTIPYVKWVEACRYLQTNHLWISQHACAKTASTISYNL